MNKKTIIRINESQLKNCIKKIIKEEVDTIKKTTSLKEEVGEKTKNTIDKWRSEMGDRKTAIKLIDYMIEKMVGVSSGDLADTATFANGIDGVENALVDGDYKGALNIAGDTAKEMIDEEIGDRDFDEIPGFEGTRDALNALRIREEKKESFMKMRAGAKGKVFENDEEFMPDGTYTVSNAGGYEIMLSDSGDMAKVKDAFGSDTPEISDWLEIEYVPSEDGEMDDEGYPEMVPVIDPNGYNIPLNMVMRIREEKKESFMKMRAGAKGKVFEEEDQKLNETVNRFKQIINY